MKVRLIGLLLASSQNSIGQRLRFVGQFLPTVADIDAEALEAEERGRRVLCVDVDIRRGDRERCGEVAEVGIVEFERCGIFTVLDLE